MITEKRWIARYLPIIIGAREQWVEPGPGETFVGIPYAHHTEVSYPFIEVVRDGKVVRTINALGLAEIQFTRNE